MKLICLVLLTLCFSFPLIAQEEQLHVGLAAINVDPEIGIPLAGYGAKERRLPGGVDWRNRYKHSVLFRPSVGIHSEIRSKAMVLKKGDQKLVLLSLDMIGLEHRFIKDLAKRLRKYGIAQKDILASATHTHGGPGTLSRRIPLQAIAVDFFKRKNYKHVLNKVTASIEEAIQNLEPADLYKSKAIIEDVQVNKFRRLNEDHFDKRASFLVAKSKTTNLWLGGLVNFSIHGGTMPIGLLHFSSDINGAIEHELEDYLHQLNLFVDKKPVFLFMNGAEGDVKAKGGRGVELIATLADLFMEQAASAFSPENLTMVEPTFSARKRKLYLGIPGSSIRWCIGGLFKKLPALMKIRLWPLMPARSYISQVRIGDITLLSWPGEPSTQLGYDLQALAEARGEVDPWVISLANDYATYFTTKEEFYEGKYDSCSSLYDYRGGRRILKAHDNMLKSKR